MVRHRWRSRPRRWRAARTCGGRLWGQAGGTSELQAWLDKFKVACPIANFFLMLAHELRFEGGRKKIARLVQNFPKGKNWILNHLRAAAMHTKTALHAVLIAGRTAARHPVVRCRPLSAFAVMARAGRHGPAHALGTLLRLLAGLLASASAFRLTSLAPGAGACRLLR